MEDNRPVLFTIGHSTHALEEFIRLLKQSGVTAVADVRSHPYSRRMPQFSRERLAASLEGAGIGYMFLGKELGARRDEAECYEDGRASYERIARLPRFQAGLDRLRQGSRESRIALLCAEREPLDCHRTILIGRHLRDEFQIRHILADGGAEEHEQTEQRLLRQTGVTRTLFDPDLTNEDLIQRAYAKRGRQIAYRTDDAWAPQ